MNEVNTRPLIDLPLGQLVATPGALAAMAQAGQSGALLLARHRTGDWGDVDAQDKAANDFAVHHDERVLSTYRLKDNTHVWVITEADRSATTILLPSEY